MTLGDMSPPAPVLGLVGPARSGKDSVGKVLVEEFGFIRVGFADAVRDVALAIDPIIATTAFAPSDHPPGVVRLSSYVRFNGWEKAKENPEVRRLLQRVGTEAGREVLGSGIWVDVGYRKIVDRWQHNEPVVVTDVRFENEVELVKEEFGGKLVRVRRPGFEALNDHASETRLDAFLADYELDNSGDLDALAIEVRSMMEDLTGSALSA